VALHELAGVGRGDELRKGELVELEPGPPGRRAGRCKTLRPAFSAGKAATNGQPHAETMLGYSYMLGRGVERSPAEALRHFTKGAEAGDAPAQLQLAALYMVGDGVPRSLETATNWLARSVAQNYAPALSFQAELMFYGTQVALDRQQAFQIYERAAALGHAPAQTVLAQAMLSGSYGLPKDEARAFSLLQQATAQRWPPALATLARVYRDGNSSVPQDRSKASQLVVLAAQLQDPLAQFELGLSLVRGSYGETNATKAAEWFHRSAQQGCPQGQNALGYALANGFGAPRDPVMASTCYRLAIAQGNRDAQLNLEKLLPQLTQEQIDKGKQQADRFKPHQLTLPPWQFPVQAQTAQTDLPAAEAATAREK
jgi:uncharacterized protein